MKKPVVLMILDGFGLAKPGNGNSVFLALKPNLDRVFFKYDTKKLDASGLSVGLPAGQMGNSEVGHMNIGAGRICYQSLTRINNALANNELETNKVILDGIKNCKENKTKFHIFGLCSDGGVHSVTDHVVKIAKFLKAHGINNVFYHAVTDGRDVSPKSALTYLEKVENDVRIASISGRYYAMDRDKNYDRTQKAYDVICFGKGKYNPNYKQEINTSYEKGITDEFIEPFLVDEDGVISNGDTVLFANFRPDRAIQLATAISNPKAIQYSPDKSSFKMTVNGSIKKLYFISMMHYADSVSGYLLFQPEVYNNLLGDVISKAGLKQLRIAETEKYAHVTFFFDGGVDKVIKGADRILIDSPKVKTYDLQPEMSAYKVCDKVIEAINKNVYDFIVLNFANCDMVGHTGVINAAVKAVEVVDECVGKILEALDKVGGVAIITADHGNCEKLLDEDGNPYTAHTTNYVPVVVTDPNIVLRDGVLSDLAPTVLDLLNIPKPVEMTARSLIVKK